MATGWLAYDTSELLGSIYLLLHLRTSPLFFRQLTFCKASKDRIREWVTQPAKADDNELANLLRFTQEGRGKVGEVQKAFEQVRSSFLPRADRRIHFLNILIGTAPLLGLLGTVAGMLTTFRGLSVSTGGDTIDFVAGISEALITTETGLVIAIPAYILLGHLRQLRNHLELFLTHLESLTLQKIKKQESRQLLAA